MSNLMDFVKDLRDAGANSIQIQEELVRIDLENYAKPENWPDRYLIHDNGLYKNNCVHCNIDYFGPKRTFACWKCWSGGKDRMAGDNTRNEGFKIRMKPDE